MTSASNNLFGDERDAGAIFVESIIAAAIVALALTGAFRVIADGAARDRTLSERRQALLVAQSRLASVGSEIPLRAGDSSGREPGVTWRVEMSPYTDDIGPSDAGALLKVVVSVSDSRKGTELARLDSVRLAPQPE